MFFAMAFLTFFRTISVKIALRIERGPEPPGRLRLSLSPHAHYVHPDFPISLRFSRIPVVGSDTSRPGPRERHQAARTCPTGPRDGHQRRDSHDRLTFQTSGKA